MSAGNSKNIDAEIAFLSDKFGLRLGEDPFEETTRTALPAAQEEWKFEFCLRALPITPALIEQAQAQALLDVIQKWAESQGYCVNGGFRPSQGPA